MTASDLERNMFTKMRISSAVDVESLSMRLRNEFRRERETVSIDLVSSMSNDRNNDDPSATSNSCWSRNLPGVSSAVELYVSYGCDFSHNCEA
eukprot:scaffold437_cov288-Chaetoceros_neogracile.AAC.26